MYNAHPYFSFKNLGKKVHIICKIRYFFTPSGLPGPYLHFLATVHHTLTWPQWVFSVHHCDGLETHHGLYAPQFFHWMPLWAQLLWPFALLGLIFFCSQNSPCLFTLQKLCSCKSPCSFLFLFRSLPHCPFITLLYIFFHGTYYYLKLFPAFIYFLFDGYLPSSICYP